MRPYVKRHLRNIFLFTASLVLPVLACQSAKADVVFETNPAIEGAPKAHYYRWQDNSQKPKGVAIAVHGLIMHGRVYDRLAHELTDMGFVVIAPDLRGYGRYSQEEADSQEHKVLYDRSYSDICQLTKAVRKEYPDIPLFLIGESLGAGMAIRVASEHGKLVDGIVLSSPAIKARLHLNRRVVKDLSLFLVHPKREVDLSPYIKEFSSESPEIANGALQDPLVRKSLPPCDIFRTAFLIRRNKNFARNIPADMPVLIIQGDQDRMLRCNGVVTLISRLKSTDQTVRWFSGIGHILIETDHILPETLMTVRSWLLEKANPQKANQTAMLSKTKAKRVGHS